MREVNSIARGTRYAGWLLAWTIAALACSPIVGTAQPANLDDLQKQLDQAKQQKAVQQPKTASPAKKSSQSDEPRPAPVAPAAGKSTLVVEADAPCDLRIDGQRKAALKAKEAVVLTVDAGKQLVVCTSSQAVAAEFRGIVETRSGAKDVLQITLASAVQDVQRKVKEEAQAAACTSGQVKFIVAGNDVLRQCGSNLEWTQADNGGDIDWNRARAWCAGKGSGWDLPTVADLLSIHDKNAPGTPCGTSTCRVSGPFQLTEWWFWSREADGPSRARFVSLIGGIVRSGDIGNSDPGRALCVRRT